MVISDTAHSIFPNQCDAPPRFWGVTRTTSTLCLVQDMAPRQWLAVGIFVGDQPWQSIGASWPRLHPDPDWLKSAPYPALPHGGNPTMDGELPSEWYIIVVAGESTLNKPKDCSGGQLCGDYGIYHMNPYDSWPVYTQFCWLNMMKSPFVTSNWGGSLDPGEPISASPMSQRFQNWLH